MRRSRYQKGSVKKQRGRWIGMWWQDGSRQSRVLGFVKDFTKSEARAKVDLIVAELRSKQGANRVWLFGEFIEESYIPFYSRKWKASTRTTTINHVHVHLARELGAREMKFIKRDDLQAVLDGKAANGLSFSLVEHLRWDLHQIFDMAFGSQGSVAGRSSPGNRALAVDGRHDG